MKCPLPAVETFIPKRMCEIECERARQRGGGKSADREKVRKRDKRTFIASITSTSAIHADKHAHSVRTSESSEKRRETRVNVMSEKNIRGCNVRLINYSQKFVAHKIILNFLSDVVEFMR